MQSRWNDDEAARWAAEPAVAPDLGVRVYTSRLLGAERALVLHGGGNTSVKVQLADAFGVAQEVLCVKASGSDLAQVAPGDFAAVRLAAVRRLIELEDLDNEALMREVSATVARAPSPRPSIETLLHAVLPFKFVEHTHADAILAVTNTVDGERIARALFGDVAPLVPFRHSGFALAKACDAVYREQATANTIGLILLHHGVVAFGDSARESYENMLRLVTRAERYLQAQGAWMLPRDLVPFLEPDPQRIAKLRQELSRTAGFPLLLQREEGAEWQAYARRPDLAALSAEGPATPQHAVFIKREPLLGIDIAAYAERYMRYVAHAHPGRSPADLGLDPAPRVIIDAQTGVWVAGINAHYLQVTGEILQQDREIKTRAAGHDRYAGLPPDAILEAEIHYGGFERRLRASGDSAALLGEVALVIGPSREAKKTEAALERRGAAVATATAAGDQVLQGLTRRYGGLDMLVLIDAAESAIDACAALLHLAPRGGRVVAVEAARAGCMARLGEAAKKEGLPFAGVRLTRAAAIKPVQADLIARLCDPALAPNSPRVTLEADGG
jgi:rhamnose utilization protein RhaD (predicted bifunctional aldolase and dehydrogenase)